MGYKIGKVRKLAIANSIFSIIWIHASLTSAQRFYDPTTHPKYNLLPMDTCGQNSADRIVGGSSASLGEFPWMIRMGYKLDGCPTAPVKFGCAGALITEKWVLTAAHCVTALPSKICPLIGSYHNFKPIFVRLGEHYTNTNPDCEQGVCADRVQDIPIQKYFNHESYNSPQSRHDIGLIRLSRPAILSEWVNTLCLVPDGRVTIDRFTNRRAIVAGWGITNPQTQQTSDRLMMLRIPIVDLQICAHTFRKTLVLSPDTQFCAGGELGKDSCAGDSGGPLFLVDDFGDGPKFYMLGVVSVGITRCAFLRAPAVYTNALSYVKWILDNLD